uniref:Uncharacterized protein n=1 Tax=Spironucleus salmonicida TaxID=348837 RepID=V6LHH5_9EUKA|eukprot:EST43743.1 Hypothetical protein SS50377_16475 [Spironucleus salmonicida]
MVFNKKSSEQNFIYIIVQYYQFYTLSKDTQKKEGRKELELTNFQNESDGANEGGIQVSLQPKYGVQQKIVRIKFYLHNRIILLILYAKQGYIKEGRKKGIGITNFQNESDGANEGGIQVSLYKILVYCKNKERISGREKSVEHINESADIFRYRIEIAQYILFNTAVWLARRICGVSRLEASQGALVWQFGRMQQLAGKLQHCRLIWKIVVLRLVVRNLMRRRQNYFDQFYPHVSRVELRKLDRWNISGVYW